MTMEITEKEAVEESEIIADKIEVEETAPEPEPSPVVEEWVKEELKVSVSTPEMEELQAPSFITVLSDITVVEGTKLTLEVRFMNLNGFVYVGFL